VRPHKDQPFYHLLAENSDSEYVAYVSEQNLLPDDSGETDPPLAGRRDFREGQIRRLSPAQSVAQLKITPLARKFGFRAIPRHKPHLPQQAAFRSTKKGASFRAPFLLIKSQSPST